MIELFVSASVSIMLGVVAWVQWQNTERREIAEAKKVEGSLAKQRDDLLTQWGFEVIAMMSQLETLCDPITGIRSSNFRSQAEDLATHASALTDQGRLFFPNIPAGFTRNGYRPALLDQTLKCCYIARHLAENGTNAKVSVLRAHVGDARSSFMQMLQEEVRPSLRQVTDAYGGSRIIPNVEMWPTPLNKRPRFKNSCLT